MAFNQFIYHIDLSYNMCISRTLDIEKEYTNSRTLLSAALYKKFNWQLHVTTTLIFAILCKKNPFLYSETWEMFGISDISSVLPTRVCLWYYQRLLIQLCVCGNIKRLHRQLWVFHQCPPLRKSPPSRKSVL